VGYQNEKPPTLAPPQPLLLFILVLLSPMRCYAGLKRYHGYELALRRRPTERRSKGRRRRRSA
jgi:hypothetical protein